MKNSLAGTELIEEVAAVLLESDEGECPLEIIEEALFSGTEAARKCWLVPFAEELNVLVEAGFFRADKYGSDPTVALTRKCLNWAATRNGMDERSRTRAQELIRNPVRGIQS